jgi:type II secretory pathway predicted ATPase ExeA
MAYTIKTDQRMTLIGQTGSGKTYASRYLLEDKKRLVVLDPKNEIDREAWNLVSYSTERARQLRNGKDVRLHIAPLGIVLSYGL